MDKDADDKVIQEKLDKAMPLVGLFVAAASSLCNLLMAADLINGFRNRKFWFPCKFFSINAATLTLLAVATKLLVDLNTNMINSDTDAFAQFMSLIFLGAALANFMTSLGSMNNGEIIANVLALVIFVFTVVGNVIIQLIELFEILGFHTFLTIIGPTIFMLVLLMTLVSLAIAVPNIKGSLELKYQEKHKETLRDNNFTLGIEAFRIDDQKRYMMKYLVMAETCSPQFVMARSVVCSSTTSAFLFLTIIHLSVHTIRGYFTNHLPGDSPYRNSTTWILYIQSVGVVLGSIAPAFRLFAAVSFKCSMTNHLKPDFKIKDLLKPVFKIEDYWSGTLVEWRDSFSDLQIQQYQPCWKYLHEVKCFILTFFIKMQTFVVLLSKLLFLLFVKLMTPFFWCIKKFVTQIRQESGEDEGNLDLSSYVLRLEGEVVLPKYVLKNICWLADQLIKRGKKTQPENLLNLLQESATFNVERLFNSIQIQSLHSDQEEPTNCWTMSVVTLTSIAIALPNIDINRVKELLSSVSEGLSLAMIVEKTMVNDAELVNIRKAAGICWVRVVLYKQWFEINLRDMSGTPNELLQELSEKANEIVMEIMNEAQNCSAKALAANSMYTISQRIRQTLLLPNKEETSEGLFEQLCVMISDIFAACFTNLPQVITAMCHSNAIEKREESVQKAFRLLGKTEEIVKLLQQREWPSLHHDKAACIDEWCALFRKNNGNPATSSDAIVSTTEHLGLTIILH